MHYIIVTDDNPQDLAAAVNEKIAEGYEPQGGVSVAVCEDMDGEYKRVFWEYAQAMIKREK